jgi:hypothetical protein
MKDRRISLSLPPPWTDTRFETVRVGFLNFLVGPNGTGKTRFSSALRAALPNCRFLSTDRISGMSRGSHIGFGVDPFAHGLSGQFLPQYGRQV